MSGGLLEMSFEFGRRHKPASSMGSIRRPILRICWHAWSTAA